MREIKFRFWIEAELLEETGMYDEPGYFLAGTDVNGEGWFDKVHITKNGVSYKFKEDSCEITPLQYTSLKDKNGKEIYEGDIVDDHYFKNNISRHKVYWSDDFGCWSTMDLKDLIVGRKQLGYCDEGRDMHRNEWLEVIGNIYENKELLNES